jgi:uncharacterized protein YgiM (DUF1202 family)
VWWRTAHFCDRVQAGYDRGMFMGFSSSLRVARATHQSRRWALRLFAALMIVGLSVHIDGGTSWIMRQAHSNEATNDGYDRGSDDWFLMMWREGQKERDELKDEGERPITSSSAFEITYQCNLATTASRDGTLSWQSSGIFFEDVQKAKSAGLTLGKCADLLGVPQINERSEKPKLQTAKNDEGERPITSISAFEITHQCNLATTASRDGTLSWQSSGIFFEDVQKAKTTGLTLGKCADLLGVPQINEKPEKPKLQTAEMEPSSRKQQPKISAVVSKPNFRITTTDEPMTAARNANVRDQPSTDGVKVAYLQKGDAVNVVGRIRGRNWVVVARDGKRLGFVFAPLLAERPATKPQTASSSSIAPPVSIERASINKHAVAVILGNRTYGAPVPDVDYATNDADAMRRFVIEQFGYRDGNIIDLRDATQAQMNSVFGRENDHHGKLWRLVRAGKSDVTVFYSGHGVPGLRDKKGYLLPVDADPDTVELNGYPLDWLLNNLAKIKARSMTVYLDACFSGESPKGMLIQAVSGLSIEPRMPAASSGMTVITAATGDQVASWDKQAKHGLFTKHLLDALGGAADGGEYGNGDGKVTVGEVKRYLDDEMTYAAQRNYGRVQTATIKGDADTVLAVVH